MQQGNDERKTSFVQEFAVTQVFLTTREITLCEAVPSTKAKVKRELAKANA